MTRTRCHTRFCRNTVTHGRHCSTCRSRKCRESDPVRYAFNNLKAHAKARGILFTITLKTLKNISHTTGAAARFS